jgi:hypothetical protein
MGELRGIDIRAVLVEAEAEAFVLGERPILLDEIAFGLPSVTPTCEWKPRMKATLTSFGTAQMAAPSQIQRGGR